MIKDEKQVYVTTSEELNSGDLIAVLCGYWDKD